MSDPRFVELEAYLLREARRCVRPPVGRFRHRWLAPNAAGDAPAGDADRFASGDYSAGLFHHDVAEAAIALCAEPDLAEVCFESLLCFLDCAAPSGLIHRIELPFRARDPEPAKPVMGQLALRAVSAIERGLERAEQHRVLPRLLAFLDHVEREHTGMHGLPLTPSARASGFDSDILTAGLPDFSVEGPDTASFMVLELEAVAELARRLGRDVIALDLDRRAAELRERIDTLLWYEPEETYVALRWRLGSVDRIAEIVGHRDEDHFYRPLESWVSLLPLYAGVPSPERARPLLSRLLDPRRYWGPSGVRTTPRDDVYFTQAPRVMIYDPRRGERGPVSNWSGPVWVLSSYYMFRALQRYGEHERARELAITTASLLERDLHETSMLHECYSDEGKGLWPRRGTFISWNVLALAMLRAV